VSADAAFEAKFGARLKRFRTAAGLAQPAAAEALGVHFSQISRYEKGQNPPSPAQIARLAKLYGCTAADFFRGLRV